MTCCLNPDCQNPLNPDGFKFCRSCGKELVLLRNRYRPIHILGSGGFGRTYLTEDIDKLNERCVIKQFAPQVKEQAVLEKATQLFQQEAWQLQQLGQHPQIPALLAYFKEDNYLYLVQEFIEGQTLLTELEQQGAFSDSKIRELLLDFLPLLQFVHQRGVIHRDIKPENIMRRKSDRKLVLIDFGVAKQLSERVATPRTYCGTLGYAPAEQMTYGETYPASDLYALGATCIHLLTGTNPHLLYNPKETRWLWQDVPKPHGAALSKQLGQILDKMLKSEVKARYQSAQEILKDLNSPLLGTWCGEFENKLATLTITYHLGDWFGGILTVQSSNGLSRIGIQGNLNHQTKALTMREIRVLSEPYAGLWNLGKNAGTLSSDEKQMSGMGQDSLHNSYSWSFFRAGARVKIWCGEFDEQPAMLTVTSQPDNYFGGILSVQFSHLKGLYRIALQGNINPNTNQVKIREVRVLSQPAQSTSENWRLSTTAKVASGNWVLGESEGIVSLDEKQMIGKGQSPTHKPYWWSFSREKTQWGDRYSESL